MVKPGRQKPNYTRNWDGDLVSKIDGFITFIGIGFAHVYNKSGMFCSKSHN